MTKGKQKCDLLRSIRLQLAEEYGLDYTPAECHHEGGCPGTCPVCDAELADLQRQLDERGITEFAEKIHIHSVITPIEPDEQHMDLEGLAGPMHHGRDGKITDVPEGIIPDDMLLEGEIMPTDYLDSDRPSRHSPSKRSK